MGVTGQFYVIKQDRTAEHLPKLKGISRQLLKPQVLSERSNTLYVTEPLATNNKSRVEYPDFIEQPLLLVSDSFYAVLKMYQGVSWTPDLAGNSSERAVVLTEQEHQIQHVYWQIVPEVLACLSSESEYYPDRSLKKMVIDKTLTKGHSFFQTTHQLRRFCIVRLDFAESILRRNLWGFTLEELEHQ